MSRSATVLLSGLSLTPLWPQITSVWPKLTTSHILLLSLIEHVAECFSSVCQKLITYSGQLELSATVPFWSSHYVYRYMYRCIYMYRLLITAGSNMNQSFISANYQLFFVTGVPILTNKIKWSIKSQPHIKMYPNTGNDIIFDRNFQHP